MGLREEIKDYQEEGTGIVSLYKHPAPRSVDNGLLFSSLYMVFLGQTATLEDKNWFNNLCTSCEILPGLLARYPGGIVPTTHDDVTGVVVANRLMAGRVYRYLKAHLGLYGDGGNFIERIPDFWPTLLSCTGHILTWGDQLLFILGAIANCFEKKSATSGKNLLYLKCLAVEGCARTTDAAIALWRGVQQLRYPLGMQDVLRIYIKDQDHPLIKYAPRHFNAI